MASRSLFKLLLPLPLVFVLSVMATAQGLKVGFYEKTCPQAEAIIYEEMTEVMSVAPSLAGPLLRMHFHDCFVKGCDASLLLNRTGSVPAEKDSPPNLSLRGYSTIDRVKARLEQACPGIVSCADVVALVARDVVRLAKGPYYNIPTGRRDGNRSDIRDTLGNLPPSIFNFQQLVTMFSSKGLSVKDLVVLSGGHTIGTSHCSAFSNRLYNFTGKGDTDPSIDSEYVPKLKSKCKPNDVNTLVEMDPGSFKTFDSSYYKLIAKRRSLFTSDGSLRSNPAAFALVMRLANNQAEFFKEFGVSMVNMGNIEVLTGTQGEIRKTCTLVN
ncbi:peroxidase 27-like [Asparagus officinalis]|uniref:peroxidase 27-like n=1 Tax=Asparagus officinalis TaxID=4686 RepID=UPI00098E6200|nr:peroxidase 27-like [Asparagus officinalis]